jgi:GxxExxY protein
MMHRDHHKQFPHGDLTARVIGWFFDVFGELGYGFSEKVLQRALVIVLQEAGMHVLQEVPIQVRFRGRSIGDFYADLIVERVLLVEVKGGKTIEGYAEAQLLNYLKAAGGGVGLLLNFGRRPEFKRMIMGNPAKSLPFLV